MFDYRSVTELSRAAAETLPEIRVSFGQRLALHTSFRVGGPAAAMFFPETPEEFAALMPALEARGVPVRILGNGTNVLAGDGEHAFAVVKTSSMNGITRTGEEEIKALCGATLARTASFACAEGLAGLEFAHGIPGSVGGAVFMNAGAYGGEMKDVVVSALVYSGGRTYSVPASEMELAYRTSRFERTGEIVLAASFRLQKGRREAIGERMEELAAKRRASQPLDKPSAGSTFKRPANGYAAAMIDQAGLKGYCVGGAGVSEKHAGFVVNNGGATFADVTAVMAEVQRRVKEKFDTLLEPEVRIWN